SMRYNSHLSLFPLLFLFNVTATPEIYTLSLHDALPISYLERMERQNRYGVYFIFKSMEQGPCFKSVPPKYPTEDPNYRIIHRDRKLYTHLYFYIRDEVLGPLAMCVGTYLPFLIFYYVNGHHYIENELKRGKVAYRKN